jgi:hypothetical protein
MAVMRCSEGIVGGSFRATCSTDKGTVAGVVECGLVRWCGRVRHTDRYSRLVAEQERCYWSPADAAAFVRSEVRRYSGSLGRWRKERRVRR